MQFYKFQGSAGLDHNDEDLVEQLRNVVKAFEQQTSISHTINADSDCVQQVLNVFSNILEDGFEGPENEDGQPSHYWATVNIELDTVPMRFVDSLEKFDTDSEKAIVWILIELYHKNLLNAFNDILNNPHIMQYYSNKSIIRIRAANIREILSKLAHLNYTIESKFLKVYEENKDDFEDEQSEGGSVFVRDDTNGSQTALWAAGLYQKRLGEPSESGSASINDMQLQFSHREQIDNVSQTDFGKSPRPIIEIAKPPQINLKRAETTVDEVKQNLERYKNLLRRPTLVGKDEEDVHSFVRDHYKKDLEEKNKKNPLGIIIKGVMDPINTLMPQAPKKILRKTSSFDDLQAQGQQGGDYIRSKGDIDQDFNRDSSYRPRKSNRRSSFDQKKSRAGGYSSDMYGRPNGYGEHTEEIRSGLAGFRQSELRNMKNSQLLYMEKYYGLQFQFEYRAPPERMVTAKEQGNKCFECGKGLNTLLVRFWPRKFYCHYTGYWYCSTCMGKEKHLIPWYVTNNFDFTTYHVCKKAREELKRFYAIPNILIDHKDKVVLENKVLYDTLVMKRQLHLLFDMICESPYVLDLMGTNSNLLLKHNLFSMKNFAEIHNGAMPRFLEKCYGMLVSHVSGCSICQAKGRVCPCCNNKTKIFPYDIKGTSVCRGCKYLYHTRCLQLNKCIVCQHNS